MLKRTRPVERISGLGQISNDGKPLFQNMRYEIQVIEDVRDVGTMENPNAEMPGMKSIQGRVYPDRVDGLRMMSSQSLCLHLQDGRKLQFFMQSSNGQIVARGGFEN